MKQLLLYGFEKLELLRVLEPRIMQQIIYVKKPKPLTV